MKKYNLLNNITGWLVFAVAAVTYLLTIEPTASFWDCGEFITTSFKLEVGHPPGAPFFMILGRFFTLFGDAASAAMHMNSMSALASAFTILFLFWTITHLAKKLMKIDPEKGMTVGQGVTILCSGVVGALAYTFSDTFWFSAVEAEVYATSSLFTAVVFWAMLKWEDEADDPYANRWIILIAYLVGLSIGVHLLNLLAIPAIVLVYYFRKYKATPKGFIISLIISIVILGAVMYGIIPGVLVIASWFELFFTNTLGAPFNTGALIYALALVAGLIYLIYYTHKKNHVVFNTVINCVVVILLGYSSFAMIVIRSSADTPMDQNSPDNVFSLLSYVNREQYGDRPLFYGQYYNTPLDAKERYVDDKPYRIQKDGKYVIADERSKPNYNKDMSTLFPRMWSSRGNHPQQYKVWANVQGNKVKTVDGEGNPVVLVKPTFGENLAFFINYQVIHMYFRYFMWNFAGRQNDIQGHGSLLKGNWISGIPAIDNARLGDQSLLPDQYKNNKGRNAYYLLPLILGLIGAFFQYNKKATDFSVVMILFILTGLAIVVYLNQYPQQPRERDYAYAASFYAFAIWIGLGVTALCNWLSKGKYNPVISGVVGVVCLVLVPGIMCAENWDDHDRSNRYTARDFGANYLNTCAPNSIIFTNGDNDTFPLWYNQEVEGVRTDMRVCNLSYLQTDWYIDQMKRKAYTSEPLPIRFDHDQYVQGTRDVVYVNNRLDKPISLEAAMDFVHDENPSTKIAQANNASYIPSNKLYYVVDKEAVIKNKVVAEDKYDEIVDTIWIDLTKSYITKDQLMVLDMISNNDWKRPIYFSLTVPEDKYYNLGKYFMLEGLAYRFVPLKGERFGSVNSDAFYDQMMHNFKWGNMDDPNVYLDENNRRMMINIRNNFNKLANVLIVEGDNERAIKVLDRSLELMPNDILPFNMVSNYMINLYLEAGAKDKAKKLASEAVELNYNEMEFYKSLPDVKKRATASDMTQCLMSIQQIMTALNESGEKEQAKEIESKFIGYYQTFAPYLRRN